MHLTTINADGYVRLGAGLRHLGYTPGAVVEVIVTCTGTLMIALHDGVIVDVSPLRLSASKARRMLETRASDAT